MTRRQDHGAEARLLRRVLATFPAGDDKPPDRAIRRRVEGAIIASELAAGEALSTPEKEPDPEAPRATS